MAYRRSHYRKGHWRQTKNGIVWISPTHVSGHEFNLNSLGNPYGKYSGSLPNSFITPNPISTTRSANISSNAGTTRYPYSFHITPEQYEEKYSEAKELFAMAKSADDYLYVEAFFLGLANYKNSQFYIDLCRRQYKECRYYHIKDSISKEKKSLSLQGTSNEYTCLQSKSNNNLASIKQHQITITTAPNKAHAEKTPSLSSSNGALNEPSESKILDQSFSFYSFLCLAFFALILLLIAIHYSK